MKNIDRAFIDDLLSRIDIVEIINDKVKLKQQGNSYKGLCPFHAENTPSFNVSSSKQFYHCFGCGASGDAIKFLQEYEGLTFVEAVEKLALQVNMQIPETNNNQSDHSNRLIKINNFASSLFKKNLENNTKAQKYLELRNISQQEIELFDLGFANDSWDNLTKVFEQKKIIKEGKELGLLTENKGKTYDRFRNRIIFPIKNTMGNVIAFGGRALEKSEKAKYIHSPESKLFYKSSQVYGLFEGKQDINK
ncbi:MAG: DNA primase, partial [Pseudomonadota bacterium]|nr:DNA primase [Pseudomonadota bacterium]